MTFDEFRTAWDLALPTEQLSADQAEVMLEGTAGYIELDQFLRPARSPCRHAFHVVAKVGCVWTALHSAWAVDPSHAVAYDPEVLGDPGPPWIGLELELGAKSAVLDLAMPGAERWADWLGDLTRRFSALEEAGPSWRYRTPTVKTVLRENAAPTFSEVRFHGTHDVELRYQSYGDPADPMVGEQLRALFGRVADALDALGHAMNVLDPQDLTLD